MASLCWNLAALLYLLFPLMHSHIFALASTSSPAVTRKQIKVLSYNFFGDYDDDDDSPKPEVFSSVKTPLLFSNPEFCSYDACSESQEPCERLAERSGCRCPGMSGADVPPNSPIIKALSVLTKGDNAGKVEVQWCAPSSVVSSFRVTIEGVDDSLKFDEARRRGVVGSLEVGTKVCITAKNQAGESAPSEFSCKRYEKPESEYNLLTWVAGGVLLILLLLIIVVIVCLCRKRQKAKSSGLGNLSYSKEETP